MPNVFVNAVNSKVGGGKNILNNYLQELATHKSEYSFFILTPNYDEYKSYNCSHIEILKFNKYYSSTLFILFLYFLKIPAILKKKKIDVVFNFSDMIIPTKVGQIYFFDWPYAVYDADYIWKRMSLKDWIHRKIKIFFIHLYIKKVKLTIAQTNNIAKRLREKFNLADVVVIKTPIATNFNAVDNIFDFELPNNQKKFLFPASYSSHKNFQIILKLALLMKSKQLDYVIVLTIDKKIANCYLKKIRALDLDNIINLGTVLIHKMPSLYKQCDALLFPTLLETYGLPYIEAFEFELPIVTSDLDFAHEICENLAYYFDPFDEVSILSAMNRVFQNLDNLAERKRLGKIKNSSIPKWRDVVVDFNKQIKFVLSKN